MVEIDAQFDAGNIVVVDASDPANIQLAVREDKFCELEGKSHMQWFYFRACGVKDKECAYTLTNAAKCSFPTAWPATTVCVSDDNENWRRVLSTEYSDGQLKWKHTSSSHVVFFAYFAPYSHTRHLNLVARCGAAAGLRVRVLGRSLDGRSMDLIEAGSGPLHVWIVARQHPGESQAEWLMEGLLDALIAPGASELALLEKCTLHLVPNMNPDGAFRGHLRTNAAGANLNREWADKGEYKAPSLERSPEVLYVLREMDKTGVDCMIDVHGDEEIPLNFISGMDGCPNWGKRLEALQGMFIGALCRASPDMQREKSYEPDAPGKAAMNICSNQIAARFDCLSLTLEQPFKDCFTNPKPDEGWSPARAMVFGKALLEAVLYTAPFLRSQESFWDALKEDDRYTPPVEGSALG